MVKVRVALIWLVLTAILVVAIRLFLPIGPCGFDWLHFFADPLNVPDFYPPWTGLICSLLSWPLLTAITLSTYTIAVMKRARSWQSALTAFGAMPLWWVLYAGQLDGLALLGVLGLPWLMPLALMKPQITGFAILAKRRNLIIAVGFLLVSLAIWGFWPIKMLAYNADLAGREHTNISLWPFGIILAALVLWAVPGWKEDKLMLAGSLVTPFLLPYQLLPLMPAIARLPWPLAILATVATWLPVILAGNTTEASAAQWLTMWLSVALVGAGLLRRNGGLCA